MFWVRLGFVLRDVLVYQSEDMQLVPGCRGNVLVRLREVFDAFGFSPTTFMSNRRTFVSCSRIFSDICRPIGCVPRRL